MLMVFLLADDEDNEKILKLLEEKRLRYEKFILDARGGVWAMVEFGAKPPFIVDRSGLIIENTSNILKYIESLGKN